MKKLLARLLALFSLLTAEVAVVGGVFIGAALFFFFLVRVVFVEHSVQFDTWAFRQMDALRAAWPGLTGPVRALTFFASLPWLVLAGGGIPLVLKRRGHRREALEVFLAVAGAALLNQVLKTHFHRLRPSSALLFQPGLSFPSGHAMIGLALYGCLAWMLWRHRRHPAWAALLVLFALLIGLTRVYLHVHYATDVAAGFASGLFWLILLRSGLRFWWRKERQLGSKNGGV
ncbi:phosphatase PAP2 family protein [Hymenobacter endophyticus]|uniref:Phosphatase PAP2 family protein n=1 Tax=Hymenobacter endophyticus TaxID=3076335 RepID=A0ABU3TKA1_9BACT|nr:phosphatase PAP2 family protein [Hymenobacter endophyticus]MDU0371793.1 phosphatase PAP2 family protein [Hymenobacter endophyticus]